MGDKGVDAVTYLPASLVRAVSAHPSRGVPWCDAVDGTMVMADLSGFTNLSERLAALGDEGAERLTGIINSFFARMLETASRCGGDTLTFGGDAILLLFDGPEHASRAVAASLAMLKRVERAAAVESGESRVKIGMSVGAHSGRFLLAATGLADERAHLFVLGRGAELTALAESQAERGQLAVSSSCKDMLPDGSTLVPTGEYWRVDELAAGAPPSSAAEPAPVSDEQLRQLAPFLPPYARTGAGNGRARHEPEHRRTVIVFVNMLGLNEIIEGAGIDPALEQLQAYSAMLTRLAAKHHGFVVSSDIATRGSKLVITFGTPMAHEYAPANAARFARDLTTELRASGLDLQHKIGMNGGHVFAGEVGPPSRRQYTVMGDAVNLAARLMAAAEPGSTLISRRLLEVADPTLCARELEPIRVKGKEQPVAVCVLEEEKRAGGQLLGGAAAGGGAGPLFGRRAELELLRESWEAARGGHGRAVLVEGEAGVGKTRLLEEGLRGMATPGTAGPGRVTRAACFEHLQAAPFTPWVEALETIIALPPGDTPGRRTERVSAYLEAHVPGQMEVGSLLNPLLALSLPASDVVGSLDARSRRERLLELLAAILFEAAGERGHVVVLEDLHWADESSLALARHLATHLAGTRLLLLLTARRSECPPEFDGAEITRIAVAELTEPEALAMVRESLGLEALPEDVGEVVYAKTRGSPLFLEEVIHSLQAPGVVERLLAASSVTRADELAALEIPDRVQGLLMSRIDRLPPDTREVLKAGSVAGRSFDARLLEGMDDELLRPVALERAFEELLAAALVVPGEDGDGRALTFRHALVQDVAYESIPFARRRDLHGRVARHLEATLPTPDHGVLVHHYGRAGDAEKTRLHAVRAAESSVAVDANREAVDYLAVALGTARARTSRDACLRSRFEELMGDSLDTLALHDEAVERFTNARRRWASAAVRRASEKALTELAPIDDIAARDSLLCWKTAVAVERGRAAYGRALRWLEMAKAGLPPQCTGLEARLLITKCGFLSRLGRFREALGFGEEGVAIARRDGDAALQAYGLTLLGYAFSGLGLLERATECDAESITLYEEAGDLVGQGMSQANLAISYLFVGDFRTSLEHNEVSLALFARVGNTKGVATQHLNLGGVLLQMGDIEAGMEHLEEVLRLRGHQGVVMITGYALVLLCQAHVWSGDLEAARRALEEGREILERIGAQGQLLDAGVAEGELYLALGDLEKAGRACRRTLSQARSMGAELSEAQALCMLGRVQLAQGEPGAAIPGLQTCVALAESSGSDYERARALAVLAEAQAACDSADEACEDTLAEAIRMFRRMGARYDLEKALEVRDRLEPPAAGEGRHGLARGPARSRSAAP